MYGEPLRFNNKKLKIMQIADIQEVDKVSPDTLRLIRLAIQKEKPDLAVFTGDQIYGLMPCFHKGDVRGKVYNTLKTIVAELEEAQVPFAVTFGNHDRQCGVSNAEQARFLSQSPYYVSGEYRCDNDRGTCFIPVFNEDNKAIFGVCLFDSNAKNADGGYQPVFSEQLIWYREQCAKQKQAYGSVLPQIVFQHIPVPEYYRVIKKVNRFTKGAVRAFRTHKNEFYILPEDNLQKGDFMLESPAVPDENSGEFDVLHGTGSVLAIAVGHDHNNSFTATYKGIKLIYTQGAGFHVYGPHLNRGVRVFELDENDLSTFSTHTLTYRELTDEKLSQPLLEFGLTHIPTSYEQIKPLIGMGITGLNLVVAFAILYHRRKRK